MRRLHVRKGLERLTLMEGGGSGCSQESIRAIILDSIPEEALSSLDTSSKNLQLYRKMDVNG